MSLLQKASIITTPTAYAEDYLYSIKPAIPYGEELVSSWTNNDFSSFSSNGTTITQMVSSGSGNNCYSLATFESGKTYELQFTISQNITAQIRISNNINLTSAQVVLSNPTSGLNSVIFTANANYVYVGVYGAASFTDTQITKFTLRERTDADFDFDRNSTGTRVNEDYLIEDVPYNLLRYSENQLGGGVWGTTGATTVTASNIANPTGATENVYLISGLTGSGGNDIRQFPANFNSANQIVTFSVWLKGSGNIRQQMSNGVNQGVGQEITLTSHWVRHILTVTFNSTSSGSQFHVNLDDSVSGTSATQFYMWGAQLVKGDQPKDYLKTTDRLDIPRIDYTNGEPSILLEPSRTNLFEYDIDFSQSAWSESNVTLQSNIAISPEGIQNASNIYPTNNIAYIYNTTTASSSVYTVSAYVKANGKNVAWLYINSSANNGTIYFDLSDESMQVVAGSVGTPTGTINKLPNGWYRLTYTTGTAVSLAGGSGVGVSDAKGSFNATQNGTDGILVYGLQLEAGSYATSLIHTSGSAVTRSKDAANNAGNSDLINSTEGVLYAEIKALVSENVFKAISISDQTSTDRVTFSIYQSALYAYVASGGTGQFNVNYTPSTILEYNKIAIKYKANDFAFWINGQEVSTDTSGSVPTGLNELAFDKGDGGDDFLGNIKSVIVFKEALTDTELEKLTGYNNHELYMNYYNRLSYLGLAEEYNVESDINNYIL